jgi:hypothetical protein
MKISDIDKKICELQELRKFLIKNAIQDDDAVEVKIFKKYIELENVTRVAAYINELGYRIESKGSKRGDIERKYISNDISKILKSKNAQVDKKLRDFAVKIFKSRKSKTIS